MTATLVQQEVCANGDCAGRFGQGEGWNGVCDPCSAMIDEHDAGLHVQPAEGCSGCS